MNVWASTDTLSKVDAFCIWLVRYLKYSFQISTCHIAVLANYLHILLLLPESSAGVQPSRQGQLCTSQANFFCDSKFWKKKIFKKETESRRELQLKYKKKEYFPECYKYFWVKF